VQHLHTPLSKCNPNLNTFLNQIQSHQDQFLSGAILKMALNFNVLRELIAALADMMADSASSTRHVSGSRFSSSTLSLCTTLIQKYYNSRPEMCFFCRADDVATTLNMLKEVQYVAFKLRIDVEEELERELLILRRLRDMKLIQHSSRQPPPAHQAGRDSRSHRPHGEAVTTTTTTSGAAQHNQSTTHSSHDDIVHVSHKRSRRRKKPKGVTRNHRLLNSNHECLINEQERTLLRHQLPLHLQHKNWNLVFSTRKSNASISKFFEATRDCGASLLMIQPVKGRCFGVFASSSWRGDLLKKYYGNSDCFLFSFNRLQHNDGIQIYRATHKNDFFLFSQKDSIAVGGGLHFGLWIDQAFECGFSRKSKTFNNGPLSEEPDFAIQNCECWSFKKPRRMGMEPFISGERVWHPENPNQHGDGPMGVDHTVSDEEFDWGAEMDEPHQIGENGSFSDTSLDALTDRTVDTIGREMGSIAGGDHHTGRADFSSVAATGDRMSRQVKVIHGCLLSVRADIMDKLPRLSNLKQSRGFRNFESHELNRLSQREQCHLPRTHQAGGHLAHLRSLSHMCNSDLDIEYSMNQVRLDNFQQRSHAMSCTLEGAYPQSRDLSSLPPNPFERADPSVFYSLSKYAARMERKNAVLSSLMREAARSGTILDAEESIASSLSRSTNEGSTLGR